MLSAQNRPQSFGCFLWRNSKASRARGSLPANLPCPKYALARSATDIMVSGSSGFRTRRRPARACKERRHGLQAYRQRVLKTLHSFSGADGAGGTGVVQATNGLFYGVTIGGGASGDGTLFALSVGLGPFVKLLTISGKVGSTIQILGYNLTGATSVTFSGLAAAFTVVSATQITATVPTGATSGRVEVVTPNRTLKSNTRFVVRP